MDRNKPVKGFTSPLVGRSQTNVEETKVFASQEETMNSSMKKTLRSKLQILNLFQKAVQENKVNHDVEVENNPPKKRDIESLVDEKESSTVGSSLIDKTKIIFNVVYGKVTSKKHKTWDGDGLLEVIGKNAVFKDMDGNVMGRTKIDPSNAVEGFRLIIGSKQIEIIEQVSRLSIPEEHPEEKIEKPLSKKLKMSTLPIVSREKDSSDFKRETSSVDSSRADTKIVFNVMYGKVTSKKHKTWDGDGLLEVIGTSATLKDLDGNIMGKTRIDSSNAVAGFRFIIGQKQIEITDEVSQELVPEKNSEKIIEESLQNRLQASIKPFVPLLPPTKTGLVLNHEPLVMPYMNSCAMWTSPENLQKEQEVLVDSCLTVKLREHQRQGIVFLYECVMGLRAPNYFGAILADEMGLGKTLQCITLIWTMLKKGPYGKPIIKRVLIITPSSLCNNWDKEFTKWLGSHRISPYVVNGKNKPKDFNKHPRNSVMIISYEMFMKSHVEINEITFDLIICDEGHKLKNSDIKAAKLLYEMNCKKRIILTGTPIQNALMEFYTLIDLVNHGILGTPTEYKHYYEGPIVASQCPHADDDVLSLGNKRAKELHERTKPFILRRTQQAINKYLPCKNEIVIFCSLSSEQQELYSLVTDAWFNKLYIQDKSIMHLSIITALKKICNYPNLLMNDKENALRDILPKTTTRTQQDENFTRYCGKVTIVQTLMRNLKKTDEKLVLVSYYTQTLDLLETVCTMERLKFLRLDGSTSSSTRSKVIEQFNTRTDDSKVFLLSAKAGGVGLNLPGASRLVLFDSDWNPASDVQAMARIWRDGQKRDVYIYRLLTTGTIEEKIYQRQISKIGLSESVVDLNHLGSLKLSTAELKDLFTLTTDTVSLTHDLMNCSCSGQNNEHLSTEKLEASDNETRDCQFIIQDKSSEKNLTINQLLDWQHYKQPIPLDVMQGIMLAEISANITFIFKNSTTQHKGK